MKITLSVIKADIGSIGGHIAPSQRLVDTVGRHVAASSAGLLIDSYVGRRCCAIPSVTWSSPSGRAQPASRPWRLQRPACTTSPASTRARTTR